VFHYPRRGFGQIPEALADAAAAADADLRLGVEVRGLRTDGPEVEVVTSGGTLRARHAFSTLPLPALAHLADPAPPPAALAASSALTFRAMVLVYLGHRGGRWTGFDAHYFPGAATPVTRISEPANYRVSTLDPDDRSVVCAEIPCHLTDPVWSADDDALAGIVHDALRTHGLPPVAPRGVAVRRVRHVYPVYTLDYAGHLAALTAWADGLDRVTSFGRLGLFAHDNTHHAIAMAYDAVAALRDGDSPDPAAWAAARARFAAHVVED
jgi:protoporphyrinogen oxidase